MILVVAAVNAAGQRLAAQETGPAARDYSSGTHVVLLGTGTPNADPDRSGPAVAVIVDGAAYIVDAGPGVVRRAAAAVRLGVTALQARKLDRVLITHLHSDHTAGLADLILTPWVLEREKPLEVFGPPGIRSMSDHLLAAYREDIKIRLEGLQPANTEGYKVTAHEIGPGVVFEDAQVRIVAFPVEHGSWRHAYGYRFETGERTIVISGDARPSETIVEYCNGCDVLVHEEPFNLVEHRGVRQIGITAIDTPRRNDAQRWLIGLHVPDLNR
jgi:ribonuclease BN (tRNA processing enzyme)